MQADSNPPAECRLSINNNALYTNNRYVTIDLYATDADPMQVWISNDGNIGTVVDFSYGKTITITDQNYSIGVALTSSNSTTSTNSNNVLRIVNWPLSSVNGTKKVYAVFRDSYGNKTSVSGLTTINISFSLNGATGTAPTTISTVKNLGIYIPNVIASDLNKSFVGWSTSSSATVASYLSNTLASFSSNQTLYAVYNTVSAGDYVYYPIDTTLSTIANSNDTGAGVDQTFSMSSKFGSNPTPVFRVLSASSTSIILCPDDSSEVFSYRTDWGGSNASGAILRICALYATSLSTSTIPVTGAQMQAHTQTNKLSDLFSNQSWCEKGWYSDYNDNGVPVVGYFYYYHISSSVAIKDNKGGTKLVIPAITLNSKVRFSGSGKSESSPYTLILQ